MTQLHKASGYLCGCVCGHSPEYRLLFPGGCDSTAHVDLGAHRPAVSSQLSPTLQAKQTVLGADILSQSVPGIL